MRRVDLPFFGLYTDIQLQVSKLSESWRNATVTKRRQRGGFGGVADLEKKRQYRVPDDARADELDDSYNMLFDKNKRRDQPSGPPDAREERRRSPPRDSYRDRRDQDRPRRRSPSRSPGPRDRRDRDRYRDNRRRDDRYDRRR